MSSITVDVALYGSLARYGGGRHVAKFNVQLKSGACMANLLAQLNIPKKEKGYAFINSVLCDVPGLSASLNESLKDGDHVGIFSLTHMWPYQYRDGICMSDSLTMALKERGAMHHTYTDSPTH